MRLRRDRRSETLRCLLAGLQADGALENPVESGAEGESAMRESLRQKDRVFFQPECAVWHIRQNLVVFLCDRRVLHRSLFALQMNVRQEGKATWNNFLTN